MSITLHLWLHAGKANCLVFLLPNWVYFNYDNLFIFFYKYISEDNISKFLSFIPVCWLLDFCFYKIYTLNAPLFFTSSWNLWVSLLCSFLYRNGSAKLILEKIRKSVLIFLSTKYVMHMRLSFIQTGYIK